MHVRNHRLYEDDGRAVGFVMSPHQSAGLEPRYLVIHYTASLTIDPCVTWFLNPAARSSAHAIVGRDGRVVQLVPFDRCAWHAGESRWDGLVNLNAYALGIELVNAGALERADGGEWTDWAGHCVPDREVRIARHKHASVDRGWHEFTRLQLERALAVARALHERYRFSDVLGHDDIAPGRKLDPGPAFPMAQFAAAVFERRAMSVAVPRKDR